ncbi:AbrB/MazE/SpoVT family DNA-binding domain-containing protein [Salicibibacter cibarius]|uniref:AbrB/MazE/SpoVT family DNA-binding domain-containing protein n=1 Tax=Salicibibacter cibarius TaxID=2743000 RepID=A0A7T6Z6R5_9BACI|nr:AbrB/MazE/SpoVT family DNA-binding domain-containing protein [Salicibibacter cibarius]QQK78028.1 AbrB/MazE/SpoVT family DNA-binding domain-containing protein [Salicibibacter cibarius]
MATKIHPYGGTYAMTIPAHVRKILDIDEDTELEIDIQDGGFFVKPVKEHQTFDDDFLKFLKETDEKYGETMRNLVDR